MRYFIFSLFFTLLLFNNVSSQELIADRHFQLGFGVLDQNGQQTTVIHASMGNDPAWNLAEWHSSSTVANITPNVLPSGFYQWADGNKDFRFGPEGAEDYELYMAINSDHEYGGVYRQAGEPWPHLLIEQSLSAPYYHTNHGPGCPPLNELNSLVFNLDVRLLYNQTIIEDGYDPNLHCAQFLVYFTVQNLNPNSSGYGKYVWLGIPVFDDRYESVDGGVSYDEGTQTLINTIPYDSCASESTHSGNWVHINVDILPYAIQALQYAWDHGYLTESQDLADYKIGGMNMGWEAPGRNISTMVVKNMSLYADDPYAVNNSTFVSQSCPSQVAPGSTFNVSLTFRNTGTTTWSTDGNYALGSQNPQNNTTWGVSRIQLPHDVAPNEEVTITTTLTAPSTPGTYNFQWRMVQDGVEWFGDYSENVSIVVDYINDAAFISQTCPTHVYADSTFDVSLTFKNTGTTTWSSQDNYALGSQNPQDNTTWGISRIQLPHDVAPNEEVTITATLTAPSTPGTYNFQWQMLQDGVEWFGDYSDNIQIEVEVLTANDYVENNNVGIKIYPNPNHGKFVIEAKDFENYWVEIYDVLGKQLNRKNITRYKTYFDLSSYGKGIYYIKIVNELSEVIKEEKVVVE
jgi:hypothetical protein